MWSSGEFNLTEVVYFKLHIQIVFPLLCVYKYVNIHISSCIYVCMFYVDICMHICIYTRQYVYI